MTLRVIPGRLAALDGDILSINLSREKSLVLFEHSRQPRLLIDGPQSAAGTADTPRNEAALISTRTKVGKASLHVLFACEGLPFVLSLWIY